MIAAIVLLSIVGICRTGTTRYPARRSPGIAILEDRYARGEIDRNEFLQKLDDILR